MSEESRLQYRRRCDLVIASDSGEGLNVSPLRISFSVKKSDAQTPNEATIRIHNLAGDTAKRLKQEFTRVLLQAGYDSNYGTIFNGTIKQLTFGKQGADTFVDIEAADGDEAINFAVVSTTLAAGSTQRQQIAACSTAMAGMGVQEGYIGGNLADQRLPRGKVMYGNARDYLRSSAQSTGTTWSVQDGKLQFVPLGGLLPSQAVVLNSKTGLLGAPRQDIDGLTADCLLNPLLQIGGLVKIDEAAVVGKDKPHLTYADGTYRLLTVEHTGDTRGNEWRSGITCLDVDASAKEGEQVKI